MKRKPAQQSSAKQSEQSKQSKQSSAQHSTQTFDAHLEQSLVKTLRFHARGLEIPEGSAEDFIRRTVAAVKHALKSKQTITDSDLTRAVTKELKKYHPDLAYVYENYDKII